MRGVFEMDNDYHSTLSATTNSCRSVLTIPIKTHKMLES